MTATESGESGGEALEEAIVKAAVEYLVHKDRPFEAALLLHAEFGYAVSDWDTAFSMTGEGEVDVLTYTVTLRVPPNRLDFYRQGLTQERRQHLESALLEALGFTVGPNSMIRALGVVVAMALPDVYPGWREAALSQLQADGEPLNQAAVGSTAIPAVWNGLRFRSRSEAAIAGALAKANVLFLPLPAAVFNLEKKEPDFLVCFSGKWGILEVIGDQFHPSVSRESERSRWFKRKGIKVVEPFDAGRCYREPERVVEDFLAILRAS